MTARIIDEHATAEAIEREIALEAARLAEKGERSKLVAVQVGDSPASRLYTSMQQRRCEKADIGYELVNLPRDTSHAQLCEQIERINCDEAVSALILQMPHPPSPSAASPRATSPHTRDGRRS